MHIYIDDYIYTSPGKSDGWVLQITKPTVPRNECFTSRRLARRAQRQRQWANWCARFEIHGRAVAMQVKSKHRCLLVFRGPSCRYSWHQPPSTLRPRLKQSSTEVPRKSWNIQESSTVACEWTLESGEPGKPCCETSHPTSHPIIWELEMIIVEASFVEGGQ